MSERAVTTIDECIQELQRLREALGGDCPLRLVAPFGMTFPVTVDVGLTAKRDVRKTVSHGGKPCVLLSN